MKRTDQINERQCSIKPSNRWCRLLWNCYNLVGSNQRLFDISLGIVSEWKYVHTRGLFVPVSKLNSVSWSCTKHASPISSSCKQTCSSHNIAVKLLTWCSTITYYSLTILINEWTTCEDKRWYSDDYLCFLFCELIIIYFTVCI